MEILKPRLRKKNRKESQRVNKTDTFASEA